jgi:drug/metabolite transporter (DMT)-like permease
MSHRASHTLRRLPPETLLVGTVLLWSFNFTAISYGVSHGFEPLAYAPLRWGLAGAALTSIAHYSTRQLHPTRRDLIIIVAATLLGVVLNQVPYVYALRLAPAAVVALVFGTLPIFISVISHVSRVERLGARHWVATAVSFCGVGLVAAGAGGTLSGDLGGILLALVTAVSFAIYSVAIVPIIRRNRPVGVNAVSATSGGIVLLLACSPALARQDWAKPGVLAWAALLYSALASIVIGNVLWFTAIRHVGPGRASLYANLQPFLGALRSARPLGDAQALADRRRSSDRSRHPALTTPAARRAALRVGGRDRLRIARTGCSQCREAAG